MPDIASTRRKGAGLKNMLEKRSILLNCIRVSMWTSVTTPTHTTMLQQHVDSIIREFETSCATLTATMIWECYNIGSLNGILYRCAVIFRDLSKQYTVPEDWLFQWLIYHQLDFEKNYHMIPFYHGFNFLRTCSTHGRNVEQRFASWRHIRLLFHLPSMS